MTSESAKPKPVAHIELKHGCASVNYLNRRMSDNARFRGVNQITL
jgi:hypothetical protein